MELEHGLCLHKGDKVSSRKFKSFASYNKYKSGQFRFTVMGLFTMPTVLPYPGSDDMDAEEESIVMLYRVPCTLGLSSQIKTNKFRCLQVAVYMSARV